MNLNDMSISPNQQSEFQALLNKAHENYLTDMDNMIESASEEVERALANGDVYDVQKIVEDYTRIAAKLSDNYYQQNRALWSQYGGKDLDPLTEYGLVDVERALYDVRKGFSGTDWNGVTYKQLKEGTSRAGLTFNDLWPDLHNVDDAQQFIADMMRSAARLQQMRDIRLDPSNPRWARVPRGKTCAFCTMLASRGFAYTSEETAGGLGNYYHADCDCQIVPSWGEQNLEGYDLQKYKDLYEKAKEKANSTDYHDVLDIMREERGICTDSRIPRELQEVSGRKPYRDPDKGRAFNSYLIHHDVINSLEGANPNYSEGYEYRQNCQRCVVAYELRRRGYNVHALPAMVDGNGKLSRFDKAAGNFLQAFQSQPINCLGGKEDVETIIRSYGRGARAIIVVNWKDGGAHAFIVENLKHGLVYLDPQTGRAGVEDYFKLAENNVVIMRTDNKKTTNLIYSLVEKG